MTVQIVIALNKTLIQILDKTPIACISVFKKIKKKKKFLISTNLQKNNFFH